MGIDLYICLGSPPCHAVQMTAKALGVDLNLKCIDLGTGDHMKPEYLKVRLNSIQSCLLNRQCRFDTALNS